MKPDKKNYDFIVSKLKEFGFKYSKTNRSQLDIGHEKVMITEIASRYTRENQNIVITRIQVLDSAKKSKQEIGLYLSVDTKIPIMSSEPKTITKEIFEIQDFLDFFKNEIREVKISKVLK